MPNPSQINFNDFTFEQTGINLSNTWYHPNGTIPEKAKAWSDKNPFPEVDCSMFEKINWLPTIYSTQFYIQLWLNTKSPHKVKWDDFKLLQVGSIGEIKSVEALKARSKDIIKTYYNYLKYQNIYAFTFRIVIIDLSQKVNVYPNEYMTPLYSFEHFKEKDNIINKEKKLKTYKSPVMKSAYFTLDDIA